VRFLECLNDSACRQRFFDPGPKKKVVLGPGEFDIRHGNLPGVANVIATDFENHRSLFDGIWKVRTESSFAGETHRMKAEDKTDTILPGSRNLEPSTHLFGIAQKEMDSSNFSGNEDQSDSCFCK
jgi:hypothetical protein